MGRVTTVVAIGRQPAAKRRQPAAKLARQPSSDVQFAVANRLSFRPSPAAPAHGRPLDDGRLAVEWGGQASLAHPVALVDNQQPIDAFTDPFGDGRTQPSQARTGRLAIDPEAFAPSEAVPPPLTELTQAEPTLLPAEGPFPSTTSAAAALHIDAPSDSVATRSPQSVNPPREYNNRDCCADKESCAHARESWAYDSISKISLDITPGFQPDAENPYKEESERNAALAESPVRTWHNRQGQVLGTGRVTNIKRGRLLILNASNEVVKIPFEDLRDDDLCFLTAWWGVPTECSIGDESYSGRNWQPMTFTWKASALCHKPLFFEEVQLERYGHTAGPFRQPVLSGAHFFLNLVTIPYQAGIHPPSECQYSLGYYRPGNCAPWLVPPIPLSVRGGLMEAGAWVGGIYLFP